MARGKIGISNVASESYFSNEKKSLEHQMVYMPYTISYSSRVIKRPTVDFGIGFGLISKNNFNKFHLSWNRDQSSYEIMTYFRSYNNVSHNGFYGLLRRKYQRFSLDYSTKVLKKATFVSTWLNIGLGIALNNNSIMNNNIEWFSNNVVAPNVILNETYIQAFKEHKINTSFQIGLENDINIRKKYFLTLNLLYIQGFGELSRVDYVHSYTKNNVIELYRAGLTSKGSGLYLGISRRFQVFPKKNQKLITHA